MIRQFFRKSKFDPPAHRVFYPTGMTVTDGETAFYIKGDQKIPYFSDRILNSWGTRVIRGSKASLDGYRKADSYMAFRPGSIVLDFADLKLYYIEGSKRRLITTPDFLSNLGLSDADAIKASRDEIMLHEQGEDI